MNHIIFCVGFILTFLIVYGTSSEYFVLSETKETVKAPFHFTFKLNYNLYLPIKLKNIPPSVTAIYFIYTSKKYFWSSDQKEERIKIDTEIKNGEVNLLFIRNVGRDNYNVLFDVQLETEDGICTKSRTAEGRFDANSHCAQFPGKYECWNANWKYNNQKCTLPNLCDIVVDFNNQCAENFQCYYNATKYICVLNNENKQFKHYKLYQTYDSDVPKAKLPFRDDYTYIEEVESCYKIHATPKNWDDAIKVCQSEGASLFYPVNSTEVNAVISFWQSTSKDIRFMYVGISDIETEGQFKTIDGTPIDEIYQKWNLNQPDNYNNNEHCLHMYYTGNYNDVPCSSAYSFICKKSLLSPERSIQHNLSSVIGAPLDTSMTNTKLIIELESFDNNTTLNAVPKKFFTKYNLWSKKIILPPPPIEFVKDNIITTLNYSETTDVPYSCQDYMSSSKKTFTALITKENKIKTFNETQTLPRKFKMADNGSILCCLYYEYKSNDVKEMQITRFVVNKKLLIYSVRNLKPGGPESQPSVVTDSYDYSWIIYVSATLIALSILVLALYYVSRQGWFKNPQPVEETVELDNQADQNQVLYANLDFVNAANRLQRNQTEEPHYASIVGVLHPH